MNAATAESVLGLSETEITLLVAKKIYFTFAYVVCIRCYKHNQLI